MTQKQLGPVASTDDEVVTKSYVEAYVTDNLVNIPGLDGCLLNNRHSHGVPPSMAPSPLP